LCATHTIAGWTELQSMFSLQKLLGKEEKLFSLLEASAKEARRSVQALVKLQPLLHNRPTFETLVAERRNFKQG
jgi:hypothetical protein